MSLFSSSTAAGGLDSCTKSRDESTASLEGGATLSTFLLLVSISGALGCCAGLGMLPPVGLGAPPAPRFDEPAGALGDVLIQTSHFLSSTRIAQLRSQARSPRATRRRSLPCGAPHRSRGPRGRWRGRRAG